MSAIQTTITLEDKITPVLNNIVTWLHSTTLAFKDVQSVSDKGLGDGFNAHLERATQLHGELVASLHAAKDPIINNGKHQQDFTNHIKKSGDALNGLKSQISAMGAAYLSLRGASEVMNLSDKTTQIKGRFELMSGGDKDAAAAFQEQVYQMSQRTGADYMMTADVVAKFGMQAGRAFEDNSQLLTFTENLNKVFSVANTDATGMESTLYNMTQALSSGVLRGQDFNSVISNAQPVVQYIADYLGVGVEQMREMAEGGKITSDVLVNSLLAATDDINAGYDKMAKTFKQKATIMKNEGIKAFTPILNKLNDAVNSSRFDKMSQKIVRSLHMVADAAEMIMTAVGAIGGFVVDNWELIEPVIMGVAAALLIYSGRLAAVNIAEAIGTGIKAAATLAAHAKAAATGQLVAAEAAATAAQWGWNTAMLASPITWIIAAIIGCVVAVYLVIAALNKWAGTAINATGVIFGYICFVAAGIWNQFVGLINALIQFLWSNFVTPAISAVEFFLNAINGGFDSFGGAVANLIGNMVSWFLSLGQVVTKIIDAIFGTDWSAGLEQLKSSVIEWGKKENAITIKREAPDLSKIGVGRWDYKDAWNAGYGAGESLEGKLSEYLEKLKKLKDDEDDKDDKDDMLRNLEDIADNTGQMLDLTEEDLKYLRDLAEWEVLQQFTTAEVKVEIGGISNAINSDLDVDQVVNRILEGVEEGLAIAAEGVHA